MIDLFFISINQLSVAFFVLCFIALWYKRSDSALEYLLNPPLTAATIPTGIALVLCAINPDYVSRLEGININLSVAGIVLVFMAARTITSGWKGNDS